MRSFLDVRGGVIIISLYSTSIDSTQMRCLKRVSADKSQTQQGTAAIMMGLVTHRGM